MAAKSKLKAVLSGVPVAALFPPRQGSLLPADPGAEAPKRGRGRPPGSKNKATLAAEALVEDFGGAIIAEKARLALMSPIQIAREWLEDMEPEELAELHRILNPLKGKSPVDLLALAVSVKERAGTDVLPFLKAKKVHIEGAEGLFQLAIFNGTGAAPSPAEPGAPAGLGPLAALFPQSEGNQEVVEHKASPTDTPPTDTAGKGEDRQ